MLFELFFCGDGVTGERRAARAIGIQSNGLAHVQVFGEDLSRRVLVSEKKTGLL